MGLFFCLNTNKARIEMKPTPKQYQEAVERTKKIKEHLIKEGYAENEESAESIIMGMSEQWYNLILEE